jgi:hypothetical protein
MKVGAARTVVLLPQGETTFFNRVVASETVCCLPKGAREGDSRITTVAPGSEEVSTIQVVHERCGSLDVHKDGYRVYHHARGEGNPELRDDDAATGGHSGVARSQGRDLRGHREHRVHWKPIYNLLEETGIQVLMVNTRDLLRMRSGWPIYCGRPWCGMPVPPPEPRVPT